MKKLSRILLILGIVLGIGTMVPSLSYAASPIDAQCAGVTDSTVCANKDAKPFDLAKNIINTLLFVIGAVSVVVMIAGGIMFATSAGDSGAVTKAKNTIFGAVIGLVIAFLAYAIVNFVVSRFM